EPCVRWWTTQGESAFYPKTARARPVFGSGADWRADEANHAVLEILAGREPLHVSDDDGRAVDDELPVDVRLAVGGVPKLVAIGTAVSENEPELRHLTLSFSPDRTQGPGQGHGGSRVVGSSGSLLVSLTSP